MFSDKIKRKRETLGLRIQELSTRSGIDQALLSKYESGKRVPSEKHLYLLADAYEIELNDLRKEFLIDKICNMIAYEVDREEILQVAESRVAYLTSTEALKVPDLSSNLIYKLREIDELKVEWQKSKPLNSTQLKKMREHFAIKYTYDSNKIEGNTLSLYETQLVVNEGITVNGKSMREHLEAINHAEAINFLEGIIQSKELFGRRMLLDLHRLVLKSIDTTNAGVFRTVPVAISGTEFMPPQAFLLEKMMEDYFEHYKRQKNKMHPIILAAEMHERLVSIHPFIDGNGRTARLIMNFILLQNGYTLAILKGDANSKINYFEALKAIQNDANPDFFYNLIADRVKESLLEHLNLT
jgi:Fic family protein